MSFLDRMPEADRRAAIRLAKWFGGLMVLFVGLLMWSDAVDEDRRKQVEPWAAMAREQLKPAEALAGGGYVKGRILPIDPRKRQVDYMYFSMREDIRSSKPDDVGTIVWLERGEKQVGKYTGGSRAYVRTARVTVIDKALMTIVARRDFEGSSPPETVKQGTNGYGSDPSNQTLQYLYSLPKRR